MQSDRRRLESRISLLLSVIPVVPDDELRAELTKHFCVLASGLLEVSCREILGKYTLKRSSPSVRRFVESRLEDFQSAKVGNILNLLREFDPSGADRWRATLSDEEAASIDSIVGNRHQIAHGRSIGLSFDAMKRYHAHAARAILQIERDFPPI